MFTLRGRPDCDTLLDGEAQRAWLVDYAGDFLTTLFAGDAAAVEEARARMGLDERRLRRMSSTACRPAWPSWRRQPTGRLMIPAAEEELATNLLGGR